MFLIILHSLYNVQVANSSALFVCKQSTKINVVTIDNISCNTLRNNFAYKTNVYFLILTGLCETWET